MLIVGGGPAGLLLALALERAALPVTLIEAEPPRAVLEAPFDGRALALMHGSKRRPRRARAVAGLRRRRRAGLGRAGRGSRQRRAHRLRCARARAASVRLRHREPHAAPAAAGGGARAARHHADRAGAAGRGSSAARRAWRVLLDDGRRLAGTLLVGADGRDSTRARARRHRRSSAGAMPRPR